MVPKYGILLTYATRYLTTRLARVSCSQPPREDTMSSELTGGICERIHNIKSDEEQELLTQTTPTLQILSIKKVNNTSSSTSPDRWRIILSDGVHFLQGMLATQLNKLVEDNVIGKNTIIVIEKFSCNFVQDKRYAVPPQLTLRSG